MSEAESGGMGSGGTRMSGVQGMQIACPDGWLDRSMLVLTAAQPGPSGIAANLVVTRELLDGTAHDPAGVARRLEAHVAAEIARWQGRPGYEEIMRRHATPDLPTAELRLVWADEAVALAQWLTFTAVDATTIVVAAATAPRGDMAVLEPQFRAMLETLRLT